VAYLLRKIGITPERLRYVLIGTGMTGGNALILALFVGIMGVTPILANWARTIASSQVQFCLNRWCIDPAQRHLPFWPQWRRHHILKAGTMIASQCLFWVLVAATNVSYIIAYLICSVLIGILNMVGTFRYVFNTNPNPSA
jgi:putative flippase GtrA